MYLSADQAAIWRAMGLGPLWHVRAQTADAPQLRAAIVWLGDFDCQPDAAGHAVPTATAGQLLLNMIRAASLNPDEQVFLSLRPVTTGRSDSPGSAAAASVATDDLVSRLSALACSRLVVLGEGALQALKAGASVQGDAVQLPSHRMDCVVMDSLANLLEQPMRRADAWAALCVIRDRFALPR